MIIKTARAGVPVFVAKSRPTARAVEAAKVYNITLLDMARGTNRIYSHVRRIEGF
jgi:formate dehydrogenase accessory protein FdhD